MNIQETSHTACALLQAVPRVMSNLQASARSVPFSYARNNRATVNRSIYGSGARITCVDRAIICRYFHECRRQSITGGGKRPQPSLRGQRFLGGRLPFKLRTELLPSGLESKLSTLNAGYQRVFVDGDVLLIEAPTRRIVDVMQNADAMIE